VITSGFLVGHPDPRAQWSGRVSGFLSSRLWSDGWPRCGQSWKHTGTNGSTCVFYFHALLMHKLCSAQISLANNLNTSLVATSPEEHNKSLSQDAQPAHPRRASQRRSAPPLILAYDIPRGIIQVVLASINILFMLTVMWVFSCVCSNVD
jgi:hypothetical protein